MDRYGAPRFRGASNQGYPVRQPTSRSGILGPVPTQAQRPQPHSILKNSRQGDWQGSRPSQSVRDGILGAPPKPPARDNYGGRPQNWDDRQMKSGDGRKSDEVSQLMKSLGLSQSDIQKLSQMPEHEINVNNLARAIGDLKKGQSPQYTKERSSSSAYDPSHPTTEYEYNRRSASSYQSESRGQYERSGNSLVREPPYSRGDSAQYNNSPSSSFKSAGPPQRGQLLQRKPASLQDDDSYGGSARNVDRRRDRPRDDDNYHSRDDRNDRYSRSSSDQYNSSQSRNEQFRTKRIVEEINDDRQGHDYGRSQRVDNIKKSQPPPRSGANRASPRGLLRGPDNRGSNNSHLLASPEKRGRWERNPPTSTGLLGNPLQPNAQGLNTLAAAVGRTPQQSLSVTQAASTVLNPLLMAGQTDPAVLEVQLQAIKVLQAEALKQQPSSYESHGSSSKSRAPQQPRQSYPPSDRGERREEDSRRNAKKEADEMRAMQGRVLYMRFKSQRIVEADLKQLASAFGKVSKILIIKAKIPNGFNQAFMEMESYDCAAAMVEHYKAKPPIVCGCSVLVDRSNYRDLQLRMQQPDRKRGRSRSISPIRKGTTQLPSKRVRESRFDDKPRLNVSVSDNRRLVTHTPGRTPPKDGKTDLKTDTKRRSQRSSSIERGKDNKRHSADRRRAPSSKSDDKRNSIEKKVKVEPKDDAKTDKDGKKTDEKIEENATEKKNVKTEDVPVEKGKEVAVEADPLDAIADELAMHDDFAIMDEYSEDQKNDGDGEKGQKQDEEDGSEQKEEQKDAKEGMTDLDQADLDLEDVNVDDRQDVEEKMKDDAEEQEGCTETDAIPFQEEEEEEEVKKEEKNDVKEIEDVEEKMEVEEVGENEEPEEEKVKENEEPNTEIDGKSNQDEEKAEENEPETVVEEKKSEEQDDETSQQEEDKAVLDASSQESQDEEQNDDVEEEVEDESVPDNPPSTTTDQTDEVARLQFIIESALQEVNNAKDQLVALNKTTKNRATVAVSKKLKLCLDGAAMRLQGADEA